MENIIKFKCKMLKFLNILNENKKNFEKKDRIKMYLNYYKNLSPKGFKIKIHKNKIIISLPE